MNTGDGAEGDKKCVTVDASGQAALTSHALPFSQTSPPMAVSIFQKRRIRVRVLQKGGEFGGKRRDQLSMEDGNKRRP